MLMVVFVLNVWPINEYARTAMIDTYDNKMNPF